MSGSAAIDQETNLAERGWCHHDRLHLCGRGDVADHALDLESARPEGVERRRQPPLPPRAEHQRRARFGKARGSFFAKLAREPPVTRAAEFKSDGSGQVETSWGVARGTRSVANFAVLTPTLVGSSTHSRGAAPLRSWLVVAVEQGPTNLIENPAAARGRCACSSLRDEAHRLAVTSLGPGALDARSALGTRCRAGHRPAMPQDPAYAVRESGRCAARPRKSDPRRRESGKRDRRLLYARFVSRNILRRLGKLT